MELRLWVVRISHFPLEIEAVETWSPDRSRLKFKSIMICEISPMDLDRENSNITYPWKHAFEIHPANDVGECIYTAIRNQKPGSQVRNNYINSTGLAGSLIGFLLLGVRNVDSMAINFTHTRCIIFRVNHKGLATLLLVGTLMANWQAVIRRSNATIPIDLNAFENQRCDNANWGKGD